MQTQDRQLLVTSYILSLKEIVWPFKRALWWNLCLKKPKNHLLVPGWRHKGREPWTWRNCWSKTHFQMCLNCACLVTLEKGLVCWGDWKSECLVYLVTTDPVNIPSSQMEGMTLVVQPVCAGNLVPLGWEPFLWGGRCLSAVRTLSKPGGAFLVFKSCDHLQHLFFWS